MADFNLLTKFTITDLGMNLITRGMAESKAVVFTAVKCADGITSADPATIVNLIGSNPLSMVLAGVAYDSTDQTVEVTATINNSAVTVNKVITEFGIYAKLAGDTNDTLFGYKNNKDTPDVLYPYGTGDQYIERVFKCGVGAFNNLGDNFTYDYANAKNVEASYFKKILMGLLGVAQHSLVDNLPDNTGNWGWFDGGEIKKTDYPDLWERVRPSVETAVANVTSGVWEYLGSNNLKSYYGWYKGTTDGYFRKPNLMSNEVYLRPSTRNGGVYQVNNIQSHAHGASSATAGAHNHTGTVDSAGYHAHDIGGVSNRGNYGVWHPTAGRSIDGGGDSGYNVMSYTVSYGGAHTHTFTTTTQAAHSHTITVDNAGGIETTPKNVGCKIYGLLKI